MTTPTPTSSPAQGAARAEEESETDIRCPKCKARSGDDWSQCRGSCPMPGTPHFDEVASQRARPIEVDYTNYRGERGVRLILPTGRMLPGDPEFHPGVPWVIEAVDCAKAALRTFDPAHIHRWTPQPAGSPIFAQEPSNDDL